jgi:acetyl esterase/lipase
MRLTARRPWGPPCLAGLLACLAGCAFADARAQEDDAAIRIELWPGGIAPGSEQVPLPQRIVDRGHLADGSRDRAITGIARPYLAVYRPARANGTALLVLPGGGYERIVIDKEASTLAPVLADGEGFTLFVLRYRLPGEGHAQARDAPLADAQRALRLIRSCSAGWRLDPHRIGVIGFSAGGHLAASLGTRFDARIHAEVDGHDAASARPDFMMLGYPVIDLAGDHAHQGSRTRLLGRHPDSATMASYSPQFAVDMRTPPTFLLHASDDAVVPLANSLLFHDALRTAGVPAELHVYAEGGHGFGVHAIAGTRLAEWPRIAADWIRAQPRPEGSDPSVAVHCPALDDVRPHP